MPLSPSVQGQCASSGFLARVWDQKQTYSPNYSPQWDLTLSLQRQMIICDVSLLGLGLGLVDYPSVSAGRIATLHPEKGAFAQVRDQPE